MKKFFYNTLCMAILSLLASCVDQQFEPIVIKEVKATISDFDYEPENEARTSYALGGLIFFKFGSKVVPKWLQSIKPYRVRRAAKPPPGAIFTENVPVILKSVFL